MLIVWGQRTYGKVDGHREQYAATRFFHVWFLPLIPLGSVWMLGDGGRGHAMRLSGKSIVAAYLRTWGVIGGGVAMLVGFAGGGLAAVVAGAAALAVGLASFAWSRARGRAAARAELLGAVLPTAIDPLRVDRTFAANLRPHVEARWAEVAGGRTPGDLIERGDATPAQRATAFALLRVLARAERGAAGRTARADSERLLDATPKLAPTTPYRDQPAG